MATRAFAPAIAVLCLICVAPPLEAKDRSARKIVKEFDKVKYPGWIKDISMEDYAKLVIPPTREQMELALELFTKYPTHKEVPRLMRTRWVLMINVFDGYDDVLKETEEALRTSNFPPLENAAHIGRAKAVLTGHRRGVEERFAYVKTAVKKNPDDTDFGPFLLTTLATDHVANPDKQRSLLKLAIDKFGKEHCHEGRAHLRYLEQLGSEVSFEFEDALSGDTVRRDDSKPTVIFTWWASENAEKHVEALRELRDAQVIFAFTSWQKTHERALAYAKKQDLPGPLLIEKRELPKYTKDGKKIPPKRKKPQEEHDKGVLASLGISNGGVFLLINKKGKLVAVTGHLEPLLPAIRSASNSM